MSKRYLQRFSRTVLSLAILPCLFFFAAEVAAAEPEGQQAISCQKPAAELDNPSTLSREAKAYLLCRLNEIRSRVALGKAPAYGGGNHPPAADMRRLHWDDTLAELAGNYAAECTYAHNQKRNEDYEQLRAESSGEVMVGENIYASSVDPALWSLEQSGTDLGVAGAVDAWNRESANWRYDSSYASGECPGGKCGHFTQNIWADTTRVGCGYYNCSQGIKNAPGLKTIVVCDFAPAGNIIGRPVYQAAESAEAVCSSGMQPGDRCLNGLITPADYQTGLEAP